MGSKSDYFLLLTGFIFLNIAVTCKEVSAIWNTLHSAIFVESPLFLKICLQKSVKASPWTAGWV